MELNKRYAITLLLLLFPIASLSIENNGFRVALNHVDSKGNFTKIQLINRAAARTRHRVSRLTGMQLFSSINISSTVQFGVGIEASLGEYFMDLAIGNPPLYYSAILDTGSDLIWTQCSPCKKCVTQPTPIYDPSKSTTASSIPCNSTLYVELCNVDYPPPSCLCSYNYSYVTGWTSGTLKKETFTLGTTALSSTVFGCSTSTSDELNGTSGLVGFGRGTLSLPSQLNTSMFSYCFTSILNTNSSSTLFVGPLAAISGTAVKSTPFVNLSTSPMSTYYYLSLQGISLGNTKLSIEPSTFMLQPNGTGGFIIDSGSTITSLVNEAYQAVEDAVDSIIELERVNASDTGLNLCYNLPSNSSPPSMPNMTFHFEDADMVLPVENYMIQSPDQTDNFWCLAMSPSDSDSGSTLGNYQQQNFHILYNIEKEVLSFSPAQCENL